LNIYIRILYIMTVKYKRLNYSNEYMHSIRLPDSRILNSIGNIHSFYRNLLCILRNFWENRKILAQNREVGQGFLRQCLRGIPVSILRSSHPRVLLLKNSLPPSYGSITWKLFVFFLLKPCISISKTQFSCKPCGRAYARVYLSIRGIHLSILRQNMLIKWFYDTVFVSDPIGE